MAIDVHHSTYNGWTDTLQTVLLNEEVSLYQDPENISHETAGTMLESG